MLGCVCSGWGTTLGCVCSGWDTVLGWVFSGWGTVLGCVCRGCRLSGCGTELGGVTVEVRFISERA